MFQSARISLTVWYLLIITIISAFFSLGIYRVSSFELDRVQRLNQQRLEHWFDLGLPIPLERLNRNQMPFQDPEIIRETKIRIAKQLLVLNAVILGLAGFGSYLLAGKTLKPIERMVDEQKRFISDASHELKTPLSALKTSLEVYLRDAKRTHHDAEQVIKGSLDDVNRLSQLTENLLIQSSLDYKQPVSFEIINLSPIIESSVLALTPLADKKHITIETMTSNISIKANPDMLQRVLVILIDNAIKYSPSKSQIMISLTKKKTTAIISISDQGKGIAQSDQEHIFDRFYQVDEARSHASHGFGLGLSIAKRIIEIHKGTIGVKSAKDKGSVFTVQLPIATTKS